MQERSNIRYLTIGLVGLMLLCACTYNDIRSYERGRCEAMPHTERERCLQRTQDTKAEYDRKRAELKRSQEARRTPVPDENASDPSFEKWIP